MKTIWKFSCPIAASFTLQMPEDAQGLSLQVQGSEPSIWALVDPDSPLVQRNFRFVGTGHPITFDLSKATFVGTCQLHGGALVFHLFEMRG